MKITINVDCTPEEARTFMGLPDLKPIQDKIMQEMHERMTAGILSMDASDILRTWLPGPKDFAQFQAMFSQKGAAKKD